MDEQIGAVHWSSRGEGGEQRFRGSIEPHGEVAVILCEDPDLPITAECNGLLYVRWPGQEELELCLAGADAEKLLHWAHSWILRHYCS